MKGIAAALTLAFGLATCSQACRIAAKITKDGTVTQPFEISLGTTQEHGHKH